MYMHMHIVMSMHRTSFPADKKGQNIIFHPSYLPNCRRSFFR